GALTLMAVVMMTAPEAKAQEDNNRDEIGRIVRGPYLTNRFGDNWFIGVGGGINLFLLDQYTPAIGSSIDANFGKWFTPSVGMRAGYQGIFTKFDDQKFGYMYIHGDLLWNFSDAVSGYKQTRFWDFVPYLHAGYYRSYAMQGSDFADNEIAAGAGLLHNLRLSNRLDLFIDMKAIVVNGRAVGQSGPAVVPSVTAGIAVNLGLPGFARASTIIEGIELVNAERVDALETAMAALEVANIALANDTQMLSKKSQALQKENNSLKDTLATRPSYTDFFNAMEPAVLFFEIGKTELGEKELKHLDFFAQSLLTQADKLTKLNVTLMGSADSNTGTMKRNQMISQARSRYVYDLLTQKYGISPDRLVMKSEVVKAAEKPEMSRAVILSF
ncbi:MAG: OmpA family protein, partial [Bacteroidales bacterium]|nr:OmpA family protein [Bacteroidales bacterium]